MKTLLNIITAVGILWSAAALADERSQAYQIYSRLNGVPPTPEKLDAIAALIKSGNLKKAAMYAIDDETGNFYNITLKQLALPWTDEDSKLRVEFTDFAALFIGMVRDEIPIDQLLYEDIIYVGNSSSTTLPSYGLKELKAANNTPIPSHHRQMEIDNLPLHKTLVRKKQTDFAPFSPDMAAGIFTTLGFAKEYYLDGTNRAAVRFTLKNFLCQDIDAFSDNTRPDTRVRRDVTRNPGGDPDLFRAQCLGCHAGMDGIGGAFAYIDYTEADGMIYDFQKPAIKMNRNAFEFPQGYISVDDSWINLWTEGPNKKIGWNGANKGRGVKSFGQMLAKTDAYAKCMAQHALNTVCKVDAKKPEIAAKINLLANELKANNRYNMKNTFAHAALMCRGE